MKNTMKKLMSLLLVAVLLVSAVPFQAKAANENSATIVLKINGEVVKTVTANFTNNPTTFAKLENNDKVDLSAVDGCSFSHTWKAGMGGNTAGKEIEIHDGDEIHVAYTKEVNKITCAICGTEYAEGTAHTCPMVTCNDCGAQYTKGTSHTCAPATVTCAKCNETYTQGTTHDCKAITIIIKADTSENTIAGPIYKVPADLTNGAQVKNLLNYCWNSSWDNVYTFDHAWSKTNNKTTSDSSAKIYAGDEVHIMLKTKTTTSTGSSSSSGSTTTNKFPYNVYLNIYKGTTVGTPAKTINITSGIALDGKVTLAEVKSLVLNYYTANTSAGITFDGLYLAKGNWVSNYVYDQKYDEFDDINTLRQIDTVYINVMIDNCTAKTTSTSTADSSNPKTGDSIFMPVAVLGISASALATAFFFANKKRLAK